MAQSPIFYDASGRRKRSFRLAVIAFIALVLLAIVGLAVSVGAVPAAPLLPVVAERQALKGLPAPRESLIRRTERSANYYARQIFGAPGSKAARGENPALMIAFHAPWDSSSAASLARHVDQLDWLVPAWVSITGPDHRVTVFKDTEGRAILNKAVRRPVVIPMVQNAMGGNWDTTGAALLFKDMVARRAFLDRLVRWLDINHAGGACFDFEELPVDALPAYRAFLADAEARFHPHGWVVTMAAPVGNEDWDLGAFARVTDKLFLMAYDEHENGGAPGPIASQQWFAGIVSDASRVVPPSKLIVAIGSYAYDWHGTAPADSLDVEEAWQTAAESGVKPMWDANSGNMSFAYDDGDAKHQVWLLDAASAYNQLVFLQHAGVKSIALWRLGSEDPGVWNIFGRDHRVLPPPSALNAIPAGTNVDIEGAGEILKVASTPVTGLRVATPGPNGLIAKLDFQRLPSPYVIDRTGYQPKMVALTFDDGPDPYWTPRILDILKAQHVPGTFFVIGENALTQRALLQRELDEGHEVGSHTYTHPNLAMVGHGQVVFELNTTQRLFQAYTGHSLRLFRAPYFGDAEPSTADQIGPALEAQNRGYISVGLHVDPNDWKRPGVQAIVVTTVQEATQPTQCLTDTRTQCSYNIVLLHDAGGDRAETVQALPIIIQRLRALGYQFVPVSRLAGFTRDAAMPPITPSEQTAAEINLFVFATLSALVVALKWMFLIAVSVGIARAVTLSALALWQARREQQTRFPAINRDTFVTVMIPAFNEERVIERAIRGVLASTDVQIEVIVIDDGSKDATSAVVSRAFADDSRVRLLTLDNGGKARALNRGLELATAPIVIALDADTQFEPTTVARLARWFVDPALGAVAGNAKVGNRVNLVTKWQALEYITAQNLERRALARLSAMTVVPGAVGAWRREAIASVGGYPADTLAEDQDLTIAIQRAGWRITYDQYAVAWTEAPETFRGLAKQRFRWAFGTLQCLWKHGRAIGRLHPAGLGLVGLPQAIIFQIVLAAISPIIDLALLLSFIVTYFSIQAHGWAQTSHDVYLMLGYWLVFTAIDLLAATVAFALERRENWRLLWLLIPQRVGYRQIMYYVVLKAITQAMRGPMVGWGKLQRTGRAEAIAGVGGGAR